MFDSSVYFAQKLAAICPVLSCCQGNETGARLHQSGLTLPPHTFHKYQTNMLELSSVPIIIALQAINSVEHFFASTQVKNENANFCRPHHQHLCQRQIAKYLQQGGWAPHSNVRLRTGSTLCNSNQAANIRLIEKNIIE